MNHPDRTYYSADLRFDAQGRVVLAAPIGGNANDLALDVARYKADGTRDSGFGSSGLRHVPLPTPPGGDPLTLRPQRSRLAFDARGRILVGAGLEDTTSTLGGWTVLKMTGDVVFIAGFED